MYYDYDRSGEQKGILTEGIDYTEDELEVLGDFSDAINDFFESTTY